MRAGKVVRCVLAMLALGAAPLAHADYKDNYARALKAYRGGDLAEARQLFQQAASEHPEAATKIRLYGQVYEPYLPQHYLGLIAFQQGDCATALSQWSSAPNRAVVAEMADISSEQQRDSATCAQKTAVAKKDDKPVEAPPATKAVEAAKPVVKNTPPPPPPVAKPPPEKPPVEKAPVVAKNEPPQPLLQAFDDFLAGRYVEVARINPDAYAEPRARFHAYLVRAAARFTLGKLGDEQQLAAARVDVKAARGLDPAGLPDAVMFSPVFRSFYEESR